MRAPSLRAAPCAVAPASSHLHGRILPARWPLGTPPSGQRPRRSPVADAHPGGRRPRPVRGVAALGQHARQAALRGGRAQRRAVGVDRARARRPARPARSRRSSVARRSSCGRSSSGDAVEPQDVEQPSAWRAAPARRPPRMRAASASAVWARRVSSSTTSPSSTTSGTRWISPASSGKLGVTSLALRVTQPQPRRRRPRRARRMPVPLDLVDPIRTDREVPRGGEHGLHAAMLALNSTFRTTARSGRSSRMRAMWSGAVSFGLVSVPVKVVRGDDQPRHPLPPGARDRRWPDQVQADLLARRRRRSSTPTSSRATRPRTAS